MRPLSTGDEDLFTVTAACFSQSLVFSQLFVGLGAPSARCCIVGVKPGGAGICVKLHRRRRGAPSDLLEEDLNSELFNVFLGRQAGRWVHRPASSPGGDDVDVA